MGIPVNIAIHIEPTCINTLKEFIPNYQNLFFLQTDSEGIVGKTLLFFFFTLCEKYIYVIENILNKSKINKNKRKDLLNWCWR